MRDFPVTSREEGDGEEDAYSIGFLYSTNTDQIMLGLTNSSGIGILDQLEGVDSNDLRLSFTVRKLLSL